MGCCVGVRWRAGHAVRRSVLALHLLHEAHRSLSPSPPLLTCQRQVQGQPLRSKLVGPLPSQNPGLTPGLTTTTPRGPTWDKPWQDTP